LDVAQSYQVEKDLDRLIERRAQNGESDPDERDELWKESIRAYHERKRRQVEAARYAFEMNMCELHERLATEHEERALKLLEEDESEATKGNGHT
jgi:hypothetical protein